MTLKDLKIQVALGEDSRRQFKKDVTNIDSLAAEMAAFSNSEGGTIFLGVADDGSLTGLSRTDVGRLNQLVSNAASQHVRSPITVKTENVDVGKGRVVIILTIPNGADKPYFDKNGVIWLKSGADKRRVNAKEELRRLFQSADQFHADELPTKAGINKLDKLRFRNFLRDVHSQELPDSPAELTRLLQNMNLATDDGKLNLAGVLLFAERPELIKPQFIIKAIRYPGNAIHHSDYLDTEDFSGPMHQVYEGALSFVMRNLHKVQAGRGVNSPGRPEIPPTVFEELLVNALVHRDYLVSATIRLFIYDNRVEIISPGHLPNNLTVNRILAGISNIRNPILVSYVAKGILPYKGLGSGIKRALEAWRDITFTDDRDGCLFTATIQRNYKNGSEESSGSSEEHSKGSEENTESSEENLKGSEESSEKRSEKILALVKTHPEVTAREMATTLEISPRAVEKHLEKLKAHGRIRRKGPTKGGHWEVLS
ncbi:MAG: RNA-binding domain-containing protein [Candidatus Ozemobacteraceae bacterium]